MGAEITRSLARVAASQAAGHEDEGQQAIQRIGALDPNFTLAQATRQILHSDPVKRERMISDERGLFEKLALETFESGLSWRTILAKRDAFRAAFAGFHPDAVASFGDADVELLLADPSIVRNRAKIKATIANARATVELRATGEPLEALIRAQALLTRAAARDLVRRARDGARDRRPRARPQAPWLSLRRTDVALCPDAGLRSGGRPPRRVSRTHRGGSSAPRHGGGIAISLRAVRPVSHRSMAVLTLSIVSGRHTSATRQ